MRRDSSEDVLRKANFTPNSSGQSGGEGFSCVTTARHMVVPYPQDIRSRDATPNSNRHRHVCDARLPDYSSRDNPSFQKVALELLQLDISHL